MLRKVPDRRESSSAIARHQNSGAIVSRVDPKQCIVCPDADQSAWSSSAWLVVVFAVVLPVAPVMPMVLPSLPLFSVVPKVEMLPPPHARTVAGLAAYLVHRARREAARPNVIRLSNSAVRNSPRGGVNLTADLTPRALEQQPAVRLHTEILRRQAEQ
jgi:hypothetical protein